MRTVKTLMRVTLPGAVAAGLAVAPADAADDPIETVVDACVAQMEMTLEQCRCAGARVGDELDDRLLSYLAVRVEEDWDEIERMRRELVTFEERVQIVVSLTRAVTICSDGAVTEIPL